MPFKHDRLYDTKDVASEGVAAEQTLVQWRHLKKGPPYIKLGARVLYPGADLVAWLNSNRIEPHTF